MIVNIAKSLGNLKMCFDLHQRSIRDRQVIDEFFCMVSSLPLGYVRRNRNCSALELGY